MIRCFHYSKIVNYNLEITIKCPIVYTMNLHFGLFNGKTSGIFESAKKVTANNKRIECSKCEKHG